MSLFFKMIIHTKDIVENTYSLCIRYLYNRIDPASTKLFLNKNLILVSKVGIAFRINILYQCHLQMITTVSLQTRDSRHIHSHQIRPPLFVIVMECS